MTEAIPDDIREKAEKFASQEARVFRDPDSAKLAYDAVFSFVVKLVSEERERCAQICEKRAEYEAEFEDDCAGVARAIAAAIRSGQ